MFAKTWDIYRKFSKGKVKIILFQGAVLFKWLGALLFVDIVILLIWSTVATPEPELVTIDPLRPVESYYTCTFKQSSLGAALLGITLSYKLIFVLFGIWVTFYVRRASLQLFNETKYTAFSLYMVVVAFIVLLPIHLADVGNRETVFIVRSAVLMLTIMGTVFVMVLPKIKIIIKGKYTGTEKISSRPSSSASDSKAYHLQKDLEALKKENKQLKQKLLKYEKETTLLEPIPPTSGVDPVNNKYSTNDAGDQPSEDDTHSLQ